MSPFIIALSAAIQAIALPGGPYDATWIGPDPGGWFHEGANWASGFAPYDSAARANFDSAAEQSNVWFVEDVGIGGLRFFHGDWSFALGPHQVSLLPAYPATHRSLEIGVHAGDLAYVRLFGGSVVGEVGVLGVVQGASGLLFVEDGDFVFDLLSVGREGFGWMEIKTAGEVTVQTLEVAVATDDGLVHVRPGGALIADLARVGVYGDALVRLQGYADTSLALLGVYSGAHTFVSAYGSSYWRAETLWCGLDGTALIWLNGQGTELNVDTLHVSAGSTVVNEFDAALTGDVIRIHAGGEIDLRDAVVDVNELWSEGGLLGFDHAEAFVRAGRVVLDGAEVDAVVGELLVTTDLAAQGGNLLVDGVPPATLEMTNGALLRTTVGEIGTYGAGGAGAVSVVDSIWTNDAEIVIGTADASAVEAQLHIGENGVVQAASTHVRDDGTLDLEDGSLEAAQLTCSGTLRGGGGVAGDADLSGRVVLELGGVGFDGSDALSIAGTANLAGEMEVVFREDLDVAPGDHHVLMSATGGWSGFFDAVWGSGAVPAVNLLLDDTGTELSITAFHLADIDFDGVVGVLDLLAVLSAWGPCAGSCLADVDRDGLVGVTDLLAVLAAWS